MPISTSRGRRFVAIPIGAARTPTNGVTKFRKKGPIGPDRCNGQAIARFRLAIRDHRLVEDDPPRVASIKLAGSP